MFSGTIKVAANGLMEAYNRAYMRSHLSQYSEQLLQIHMEITIIHFLIFRSEQIKKVKRGDSIFPIFFEKHALHEKKRHSVNCQSGGIFAVYLGRILILPFGADLRIHTETDFEQKADQQKVLCVLLW